MDTLQSLASQGIVAFAFFLDALMHIQDLQLLNNLVV